MPYHKRRKSLLMATSVAIQHSDTFVANIGGGSAPASMVILDTEAGARPTTGGTSTIQVGMGTNEEVNVGSTVKYINLFIQAGERFDSSESDDTQGWLEWAVVLVKETETAVPITQLGIQTLGDVCTKMFLNECIYTGALPIGVKQPNYLEIKLKIPRAKQNIRRGDQWRFITSFRDLKATSTATTRVRLIKSFMYKSYH